MVHQKFLSLIVVIGGSVVLAATVGVTTWLCVRNYKLYGAKSSQFILPLVGGSLAAIGVAALLIFGIPWIRKSGHLHEVEKDFLMRVRRSNARLPLKQEALQYGAALKDANAVIAERQAKIDAAENYMNELNTCKLINPNLQSLCSGADSACERLMTALSGEEGLAQYRTMRRLSKSPYEVTNLCSRAAKSILGDRV
jgi:hypothetical protein